MKFVLVASSNILAIGYEESAKALGVMFKNGGLYIYTGVPKRINEEFIQADSKGKFLNQTIKPYYEVFELDLTSVEFEKNK